MSEHKLPPFVHYYREDKSIYPTATEKGYHDPDNDFLVGNSGGFLYNINFVFRRVELLREAANYYTKYGVYTKHRVDTPPHRRFRVQEERRRSHGYTARCKLLVKDEELYDQLIAENKTKEAYSLLKPLTISGEHYNFINYGTMQKLDEASVITSNTGKVTGSKVEGAPIFFGAQYFWYKSKVFAKNNGFHIIAAKTRRAGFSYMEAIGSASTVNLNRKSSVIHVASDIGYITEGRSLTRMSMMQLEHYENNTPFNRGFISSKIEDIHLGYKKKDNSNAGFQSHLLSLTTGTHNPGVAIGKDAIEIKCEELSEFTLFDPFMTVTEPTTRTGSVITGLISAWGTGGSEGGTWIVFERNFYNPEGFNFMPFENIWDKDARDTTCGFYKPYIDSLQGFTVDGRSTIDADGNTDYELAYEVSLKERADYKEKAKTVGEYIIYCGQYGNMPSESFSSSSDNIFSSDILTSHVNNTRHNPDVKFYTDGMVYEEGNRIKFKSNTRLHAEGHKIHPYLEDLLPKPGGDRYGCVRIWHPPYVDPITKLVPNIYSASYDSIGKSKDKEDITNKHSNNSGTIWMEPNEFFPGAAKLRVASWYGRPPSMETSDDIMRMLCIMYGGHARMFLAETNRGELVSNFKKWKVQRLLAREPIAVWDSKVKPSALTGYGLNLSNDIRKLQGLRLARDMLYEKVGTDEDGNDILWLHTIKDVPFLLEIQKFKYEGNFDRISDFIVHAFEDKRRKLSAKSQLATKKRLDNSTARTSKDVMEREWF